MTIELNVYHTIAIAIVILIAGEAIRNRVMVLQKYCIPVPVVGGLLCTVIILIGHETGAFEIKFDMAFKDFFMLLFYSGIGFTASWKLLKKGGPQVIIFLIISSVVVVFQNLLGVGLSKLMGIDPLIGLATGSIPMTGGHGTSAAFAPVLEEAGLANANTISLAAATFGLVAGSLIGGPTGRFLIEHYHLKSSDAAAVSVKLDDKELGKASGGSSERALTVGAYQLLIAVSLGCLVSDLLAKTGLSFPASVGGMTAAAIIRNIADNTDRLKLRHRPCHRLNSHDRRPRNVGSIRSRFRGGRTCKCQHNFAGRRYIRPGCRQPDRRADRTFPDRALPFKEFRCGGCLREAGR